MVCMPWFACHGTLVSCNPQSVVVIVDQLKSLRLITLNIADSGIALLHNNRLADVPASLCSFSKNLAYIPMSCVYILTHILCLPIHPMVTCQFYLKCYNYVKINGY